MEKKIMEVGFDKQGDADFGISDSILDLDYAAWNELRAMLIVAIGTAEMMWRNQQQINNLAKNKPS